MAFEGGPYVQVACFCDMVLQDTTGVLSLIRVVDTLTHTQSGPAPPEEMPPVSYAGKLVVVLKSGKARGRYDLKVVPEAPTGGTKEPLIVTVHFEGEERGASVVADFHTVFEMEGLHWFRVYLEEEELTAIPFRVKYSRMIVGSTARQT